jgi:hypothetical protein
MNLKNQDQATGIGAKSVRNTVIPIQNKNRNSETGAREFSVFTKKSSEIILFFLMLFRMGSKIIVRTFRVWWKPL